MSRPRGGRPCRACALAHYLNARSAHYTWTHNDCQRREDESDA